MSRAKALCPNRRLRQSKEDRPPGSRAAGSRPASFRSKKLGWLEIASSQPGVAIPVKTNAGNNRDNDDDGDNNDARRTGSTAGNRIDNKV